MSVNRDDDGDDPVTVAQLDHAVRTVDLDHDPREALVQLATHVATLSEELARRLETAAPRPTLVGPFDPVPGETLDDALDRLIPDALEKMRIQDASIRIELDASGVDKYATPSPDVRCDELVHLCHARCCRLSFALSSADLDEGVIRWEHGQPYRIRQRATDGYCVHNDLTTRGCTAHTHRPRVCRSYDCRDDVRIWKDFAKRIPADPEDLIVPTLSQTEVDLVERLRSRRSIVGK